MPAGAERSHADKDSSGERLPPRGFFHSALTAHEQRDLVEAEKIEGLDQEIAVLRVRLKTALSEQPPDLALVLRGFDLLVKAVAAQYRLSPRASKDLGARVVAAMKGFEDQLLPPDP